MLELTIRWSHAIAYELSQNSGLIEFKMQIQIFKLGFKKNWFSKS